MLVDFHGLYKRYAQDIFRFALYLSGDSSLAEEITQETFVRAWITPGQIRGGTVKAYLLMIARNLYRAEWKRAARHAALDDTVADPNPGPAAVMLGRAELSEVLAALQTLPETDRAVLLMHAHDELSHAEIASALGLTVAAVKVRIHRSRIKLRLLCNNRREAQS